MACFKAITACDLGKMSHKYLVSRPARGGDWGGEGRIANIPNYSFSRDRVREKHKIINKIPGMLYDLKLHSRVTFERFSRFL